VNFDLGWNPQRIEQRIGRIDRIGQNKEVFIFNLVAHGTVEEYVVHILSKKLRMFEMVVGEMSAVLGHMESGKSFEQMIKKVWLESNSQAEEKQGFKNLAQQLEETRKKYDKSRTNNHVMNQIGQIA